jgi:hypothetical protein
MPNEQTSVPLFTSGEVLTAANMNISAGTGVPVFATAVTRDAAFGGTGEKTLAEGQFAYIEATDNTQYYNGTSWINIVSQAAVDYVATSQSSTLSAYTALATASAVTLTTGTRALVTVSCVATTNNTGLTGKMGFSISGATTTAASDAFATSAKLTSGATQTMSASFPVTLTAGSNTFTTLFSCDFGGNFTCSNRTISVLVY